ncbi:hypothetical protein [Halorubrum sp. CSM-61]|uniref:hypothetical protein n=1 Tax=Halorubrum sp. CSM-61 TaxID=2485838 RepID=UPI000F4BE8DD|nr:hypothetical protein [Halorubrum sp. CSM-61]
MTHLATVPRRGLPFGLLAFLVHLPPERLCEHFLHFVVVHELDAQLSVLVHSIFYANDDDRREINPLSKSGLKEPVRTHRE